MTHSEQNRSSDTRSELRRRAEASIAANAKHRSLRGQDELVEPEPDIEKLELEVELDLHRVELELQNEELRRAQARLEASNKRYRQLYEHAPLAYVTVRPSGHIVEANRAAAAFLGCNADALRGAPLNSFMEQSEADRLHVHLQAVANSRSGESRELRFRVGDTVRFARTDTLPAPEAGPPLLCALTDLTELVQAKEGLEEANERLECRVAERTRQLYESQRALAVAQKMEALGRLAGGIAHDFSNVLTVVNLLAREIENATASSDPRTDAIKDILGATRRAMRMVGQLREFTSQHGTAAQSSAVQVDPAINGMLPILRRLIGDNIELQVDLGAPNTFVPLDDNAFERLLMNLVTNARDAMPSGGAIRISTSCKDSKSHDDESHFEIAGRPAVIVRVEDTGAGMTEETRSRLFEPFFTTKPAGTGIGLATVYSITKRAGGSIEVDSEIGGGTIFLVFLPAIQGAEVRDDSEQPGAVSRKFSGSVLLVDDEPAIRRSAARIIRAHGFEVSVAMDGLDALELFAARHDPFDALVTDVVMPRMSGTELARQVAERYPTTAILLMSGNTGGRKLGAGANFLAKPFEPGALIRALESALSKSRDL